MINMRDLGIKVIVLDGEFGQGYALLHETELQSTVCITTVSNTGELFCASAKSFDKIDVNNIEEIMREHLADGREHVPWAFAMLNGDRVDSLMGKLELPYENRDQIKDSLRKVVELECKKIKNLDQNSILAISKSAKQSRIGYDYYSGTANSSIIRRQAAMSYPVLADFFSSNLALKMAVDRKKPIADVLSHLLSKTTGARVTKPVLKRLAMADAIPEGVNVSSVIRLMASVPPDWIPTSGREWMAFCNVATGLFDGLNVPSNSIQPMIKTSQGRWFDFCHRVIKRAGHDYEGDIDDQTLGELFQSVINSTSEMVSDFRNLVVLPLAAYGGDANEVLITPEMMIASRDTSFQMLFENRSLVDVADLQRRFFLARAGMLSAVTSRKMEEVSTLLDTIEGGDWPGLTSPVQSPSGLWLVPLTSKDELAMEGAALQHCVGSYEAVARRCESFIVSVRSINSDGEVEKRHSTVEFLALNPSNDVLRVKQHFGSKNSPPNGREKDAVAWYVASVGSGHIKLNRKLISAYLDGEIIPSDGVERLCHYDWKDRQSLNLAIEPWFPFVTKRCQKMTLDDLVDSPDISFISDMIAPDIMSYGM